MSKSKIGSQQRPMASDEPMKVARAVLENEYMTPNGGKGLINALGRFWEWHGGRWVERDVGELTAALYRALEDAHVEVGNGVKRYKPTSSKIEDVVGALSAVTEAPYKVMPVWLMGADVLPDAGRCVAFRDQVVSVAGGVVDAAQRSEIWFDHQVAPVDYVPGAPCPRWMQALEEWSEGDRAWVELLQRWMGYCMMSYRGYAKWLLMEGKSRGGKGVISKVIEMLVGKPGFLSVDLDDLHGEFGLDGMQLTRVLNITEASQLASLAGAKVARVVKCILGEDALTVNAKFQRQIRNVRCAAAPMMSSNMIPMLPNEGKGISTKMLVLPFSVAFDGDEKGGGRQPQFNLLEVLKGELTGIAAWALEGARALEAEVDPRAKWPSPEKAGEVVEDFYMTNNPMNAFLAARFEVAPNGVLPTKLIWREWNAWLKATGVRVHVPRNQLLEKMVHESTWSLSRGRKRTESEGQVRTLRGLAIKKQAEDE